MCISPQRRAILRHLNFQKWSEPTVFCTFWLANVLFATAAYNFSASELPKVVPDRQTFSLPNVLFATAAYNFSTSELPKVVPDVSFLHFHFRMCFSPQRRAIFRHLNFQKWSRTLSVLTFWLANVLFATAACNFWCHLSAPTSAPAALTGLLLDWPDTRIYWKNTAFRDFSNIWRGCIFFLLTFWLLHLLSTDLTTLLLLFNSPYCRKFLFKLPSMKGGDSKCMTSVRYLSPCPPWTYVGLLLTTTCQISRSGNVKWTKMWKTITKIQENQNASSSGPRKRSESRNMFKQKTKYELVLR